MMVTNFAEMVAEYDDVLNQENVKRLLKNLNTIIVRVKDNI